MFDKYIAGMSEIKADDRLKTNILKSIEESNHKKFYYKLSVKKIVLLACALTIILTLGLSFIDNNFTVRKNSIKPKSDFAGFIITAYAANGSPIEIKPNVDFIIGKYRMTMNSVPGFPLKVVCQGSDVIRISATGGEFILWNSVSSTINNKGKELEVKSGDTIYWSPLDEKDAESIAVDAAISIKACKRNKEIENSIIKIRSDNKFTYTGVLVK